METFFYQVKIQNELRCVFNKIKIILFNILPHVTFTSLYFIFSRLNSLRLVFLLSKRPPFLVFFPKLVDKSGKISSLMPQLAYIWVNVYSGYTIRVHDGIRMAFCDHRRRHNHTHGDKTLEKKLYVRETNESKGSRSRRRKKRNKK